MTTDAVSAGGERDVLEAFLDTYRDVVVGKVDGLAEEQANVQLVSSGTTPAGIVKHLRWVEVGWFRLLLAERRGDNRRPHPRETEFTVDPAQERLADLVEQYRAACRASREVAAGYRLDDVVPHRSMGEVSLRWVYVHMIEETARHAGHLDILREQLDGSTCSGIPR